MMLSFSNLTRSYNSPRPPLLLSLVLVSLWVGNGHAAPLASQLLSQAASSAAAGKFGDAGDLYTKAAQAFHAQGQARQESDAEGEAAKMYEKQADQLLAGVAGEKAAAPQAAVAPQAEVAPQTAVARKPAAPPKPKPEAFHPAPVFKAPPKLHLLALARRHGYVIGRALFSIGRAIPEFTVSVAGYDAHSDDAVSQGAAGSVGYTTGHGGKYAAQTVDAFSHKKPVNALVVQVSAQSKLVYRGETYTMDLCPLDGKGDMRDAKGNGQFSARGLTRDFVLKIAGHIPGKDDTTDVTRQNAYYGQRVAVDDWDVSGPTLRGADLKGASLLFIFTPQGALLDGSPGQTVTRRLPVSALGTEAAYLLDIPIGCYGVQAQIMKGGTSMPLVMHWSEGDKTYGLSKALVPHPERLSVLSGAEPLTLEVRP